MKVVSRDHKHAIKNNKTSYLFKRIKIMSHFHYSIQVILF
jgi:hypothetical protein